MFAAAAAAAAALCSTIHYGALELTNCTCGWSVVGHHTVIAVTQEIHYILEQKYATKIYANVVLTTNLSNAV